jgi:hypothetical protein
MKSKTEPVSVDVDSKPSAGTAPTETKSTHGAKVIPPSAGTAPVGVKSIIVK